MNGAQSEHVGDFFRVRIFKNGNAHLWFTRKDLLAKVNKLLAEHYGAALGDGPDRPEDADAPFRERAVGPAKNFGFFPTPDAVADRVIEEAHLYEAGGFNVLEPSAGTGALARRVRAGGHRVDVVEVQAKLVEDLRSQGIYRRVLHADFLGLPAAAAYDRVVMNPPFDRGRDVDHVVHAWDFLKPGGRLVAVMSASTEFRQDKKATAFRALLEKHGRSYDLPAGSFAPATNVNTILVVMTKKA